MLNKPVRHFYISFILFLISYFGGNFPIFYKLINQRFDWLFLAGMIMSALFAIFSIIGLVKQYRLNKTLTATQIIALALSSFILLILIYLGLLFLLLSTGLPPQD